MATAKKPAPKAQTSAKKITAPSKALKPTVKVAPKAAIKKAPVSKTARAIAKLGESIAKLTERKDRISAEIKTLREQRASLKAAPVAPAPAAPKAMAAVKATPAKKATAKSAKPAVKK